MGMCLLMEGEQCTRQRRLHSRRVVHKKTEHKGQPGRWGRDMTEGVREGADNFASGGLTLTDGTVRALGGWHLFSQKHLRHDHWQRGGIGSFKKEKV